DTERFRQVAPGTRVALRSSIGVQDREFVWLAVGRFELAKDYPNMLRAFAQVRQRESSAVLLLVGHGSLQVETQSLAQSLGLGDRVRFLGVRSDVPEVMASADGYVMSSAWEGMPIALLEAAAAGLPIVTTRVGGNHEVVRDGESGYLVPPRDHDALGQAMLRLMQQAPEERRAMGERGREHVRVHYGLGRVVERWEDLYRQVSARKGLNLAPTLSR
ncbi:MAG TPA: glycosyltransferase, partial [Gemmatimonadales bacterium]|nr:glycosyltransferase [Gemmatimonadales bacterium]